VPAARPVAPPAPAPAPAARKDPFGLADAPTPVTARAPAPVSPAPTPAPIELGWDDDADTAPTPSLDVSFDEPAPAALDPIELPAEEEEPELAPLHAFVPPPAATGHQPAPAVAAAPVDGGEGVLRDALSRASREVIERVVWEVVPQLAETIIRENLDRLVKLRQE